MNEKKSKVCGAKTRSGESCKRAPMRNGRCYLHGGASLGGYAHPNFKHGLYSKDPLCAFEEKRKLLVEKQVRKTFREFDRFAAAHEKRIGRTLTSDEILELFHRFARRRQPHPRGAGRL